MKKAYIILACLFASLLSLYCRQSDTKQQTASKFNTSPLEGFWILTDAVDSTVQNRAIARYLYPKGKNWFTITYVVLQIENDSMSCTGINGFAWRKVKINLQDNTRLYATETDTLRCRYVFSFDAKNQILEAKTEGKLLKYRRFNDTSNKIQLVAYDKEINKVRIAYRIWGGYFEELFLKGFLAGKYVALDKQQDVQAFKIQVDYVREYFAGVGAKVEGFKCFANVKIEEHFGAHLPFKGRDGLHMIKPLENCSISTEGFEAYEFQYKGDTLFLQEVTHQNKGDMYYNALGAKKYKFLKVK